MGLFNSVNYFDSTEVKKLYSQYEQKYSDDSAEFVFSELSGEEAEEQNTLAKQLDQRNGNYERAIAEIQDAYGGTRAQAEKMISDMAERKADTSSQLDYISEMTGMSIEEAEQYLAQQQAVDKLQDEAYEFYV